MKPNCPWPKSGSRSRPSWRAVPDRAELLPKRCREPRSSLPPDLVMTLTKPPLERPNSALAPCGHHDHLLHGVEIEGEGRALAAALLAEEGVVEVGPVHGDVVVNAPLPGDAQLVAVRSLDDGSPRGQQRQVEEVAAVVGQVPHRLLGQARGRPAPGDVHRGRRGLDNDLLHLREERNRQLHRLPHPHLHPGPAHPAPPGGPHGHVVGTKGQKGRGEEPEVRRGEAALVGGPGLPEGDLGPGHGVAELIPDKPPYHPGRRLRLGLGVPPGQEEPEQDSDCPAAGSPWGRRPVQKPSWTQKPSWKVKVWSASKRSTLP